MRKEQANTLKKIKTKDLTEGMFVFDVGRSWFTHPWAKKSKLITSAKEIKQLREYGIAEVVIDVAKGLSPEEVAEHVEQSREAPETVTSPETLAPPEPERIEVTETEPQVQTEPIKIPKTRIQPKVSMAEEMPRAQQTYAAALETTREFMAEARAGKQVNIPKLQDNIEELIDTTSRNFDASLALMKLKKHDDYTYTHALNVSVLAISMGCQMRYPHDRMHILGLGALLHDIGKTGIPLEVLNNPGRLSDKEYEIVKKHPVIGSDIIQKLDKVPTETANIARHHHEKKNGSGYPDGLKDRQITDFEAITGLADVYDALSSDRVYRKAMLPHLALKTIFTLRDQQFDNAWVEAFIQCLGIYPAGTLTRLNTGEIVVVVGASLKVLLRPRVKVLFNNKGHRMLKNPIIDLSLPKHEAREITKVLDPRKMNLDLSRYL